MTEYDPRGDPRYIPYEPAPLREDVVELGDTLVKLETAQETWDRLIDLFDHVGWAELAAIIAKDRDAIERKIKVTTDHYEWAMLRGQLLWADFVLSLPEESVKRRQKVMDHIKQVSDALEGEEQTGG